MFIITSQKHNYWTSVKQAYKPSTCKYKWVRINLNKQIVWTCHLNYKLIIHRSCGWRRRKADPEHPHLHLGRRREDSGSGGSVPLPHHGGVVRHLLPSTAFICGGADPTRACGSGGARGPPPVEWIWWRGAPLAAQASSSSSNSS